MEITSDYMTYEYSIGVERGPDDKWPYYVDSGSGTRYSVDHLNFTVRRDESGWQIPAPRIIHGWRVRADGSLGAHVGRYHSYWAAAHGTERLQQQEFLRTVSNLVLQKAKALHWENVIKWMREEAQRALGIHGRASGKENSQEAQ